MFWSAENSLLRAEGFSGGLVLGRVHGGLFINILQFLIKKRFFSYKKGDFWIF
jgi:hypothetical protein